MNKLFTKVASICLGLAMAVGVGVAVSSANKASKGVEAAGTDSTQYALITSTDDLEAGKSYIFTNGTSGTVNAMAVTDNANNRRVQSATVTNNKITRGANILSVTLGGSAGAWTFATENYAGTSGYFASAASGKNNHLRVISTANTATISFSSGEVVVNIGPHSDRTRISYNSSNGGLFACYSGKQNAVYLWKEVASKTVSSVAVKTAPSQVKYNAGDFFNPANLVITATYSDNTTEDIQYAANTGFSFSPSLTTALTTSDTSVTITYGGKSASQSITVYTKTVVSIAIKTNPTKMSYKVGESFSSTGLEITATYISGLTEDFTTGFTITPSSYTFVAADETAGSKDFTITYSGQTTTLTVTVASIVGPIPGGRYYIMNSAKTYALNAAASASASPTAFNLSTANNALMPFDVDLVADNEYEISITISSTKYYLVCNTTATSSSNSQIRVTNSPIELKTKHWVLSSTGVSTAGAYHVSENTTGSTNRYLSMYNTQDWRGYVNTDNGDPEIQFVAEGSLAAQIVSKLNASGLCNDGLNAPSTQKWTEMAAVTKIQNELNVIKNAEYTKTDTSIIAKEGTAQDVAEAAARYDYIVGRYGTSNYGDFLSRNPAPIGGAKVSTLFNDSNKSISTIIIVVVSVGSLIVVSGFFLMKRKEHR